ncbi:MULTISPECIES: hypothetical protein [Spirosoma]|uniref:Uncharacterized protein n=1 Tax=Spirosoma sordidisoli TaxID=2502893 RepID=A0A4V1RW65_9BACT|nr:MULTISPECIES: hypothetical protein [Spirosoma]RYC69188.1 hypothetical protein EQG79_17480 [Spirosoma sordidisoli]
MNNEQPNLDRIIQHIAHQQEATGLFPSVRHSPALGYRRPDTNVFFTAVTLFTLQPLYPACSPESQQQIDRMLTRARAAYPRFRNKDGLDTFNFWPTRPSQHFPNGYLFRHFDHFRIPDDIDDTAMVYLTEPRTAPEARWLKEKLSQHANLADPGGRGPGLPRQQIRTTYPDYRDLRVYSTWFGKTMPIDFDACALSNLLYCIYHYDLPRNQNDADSLTYLRHIVESGRYVADPFRCAPHYARTSLIIYHLARFVAAFSPPELEPVRHQLVADARQLLTRTHNRLDRLLLCTSLLRLGSPAPPVDLTSLDNDISGFHFFIAGMLTAYEQPWLRRWADRPITQMRWQCDAHSWALVAEYIYLTTR